MNIELLRESQYLRYDVCIIGSGAGGAVVGAELAKHGYKTIILEQGKPIKQEHRGNVLQCITNYYAKSGFTYTFGRSPPPIVLPYGESVGGTTTINSGTCMRLPDRIFSQWKEKFGISFLGNLQNQYKDIEHFLNITPVSQDLLGGSGKLIQEAAKQLGLTGSPLLRNVINCRGSGTCAFGCPALAKQSTELSFLPQAQKFGAKIIGNCHVEKILTEQQKNKLVYAYASTNRSIKLKIEAEKIILAGGAIGTPLLLKNSTKRLKNSHIGQHLHIHPAARVLALFNNPVEGWKGVPQSFGIKDFQDQGIMLEGFFLPPALVAYTIPFSGPIHRQLMNKYPYIASFGVMITDTSEGRIIKLGNQVFFYYTLNKDDVKKLYTGIGLTIRLFFQAGARIVFPGIIGLPIINSENEFSKFMKDTKNLRNRLELTAFHPLGTCRMAQTADKGTVNNVGETFFSSNVFIADGSIIPTSIGVNPQLTIMAIARFIAENIYKNN